MPLLPVQRSFIPLVTILSTLTTRRHYHYYLTHPVTAFITTYNHHHHHHHHHRHLSHRQTPFLTKNHLTMTTTTTSTTSTNPKNNKPSPPTPQRDPTRVVYAGTNPPNQNLTRQSTSSTEPLLSPPVPIPDPYGWMRDESRTDPTVLRHLRDENAYTETQTSHLGDLRGTLYEEMMSSIKETDYSLPRGRGDWWYYTRTMEGLSYRLYCRAPRETGGEEEGVRVEWDGKKESPVLPGEVCYLDVNKLAKDRTYCSPGRVAPSPSHNLLAYTVDYKGDETCQLYVTDITTGDVIEHDPKLAVDGQIIWGADDKTLFYVTLDDALRSYRVYRHVLGSETSDDELLFEESDELLRISISKTTDDDYLFIRTSSKETSEIHYLDLASPTAPLRCIAPRRSKVLYRAEHREGCWLLSTNVGGTPNLRLMTSPAVENSASEWRDVTCDDEPIFDGGYDRSLSSLQPFKNHVVAEGREDGIPRIWILSFAGDGVVTTVTRLGFDETAYDVGLSSHYEFDSGTVVVGYDSLVAPLTYYAIDMSHPDIAERKVLKETDVPGYEKSSYGCERILVPSRDGTTMIPTSLVYRRDVMDRCRESGEPAPLHLYGYGSYGASMEASFRSTRLSLLDRGVIFAIAHVRGGGEMGRQWYEEPNGAKYLCKKNTFFDFVDVARYLINEKKLTKEDRMSCEGRSAGGLLIGASLNDDPGLFRAALLGVPFVDVVCTMVDATIPLTIAEWVEWGNPNEVKYYQYMMEYSPINNIREGATYPACLITGGLHDPRVQYWEPAKYAAELRHVAGDFLGPICVKMDMTAGHFSASDRYKYYKELAFDYAFILDQLGLADAK